MNIMGYVFKALGFESDEVRSKPKKVVKKTQASFKFKNGKMTNRAEHIDGIPVYYPESFGQAKEYAQFLRDKKAFIISVDSCSREDGVKICEYFQGVAFGIKAKMINLEEDRLYLLLPEGMEVEE
jgi:FtsZ-interacting cell division protein YlmF